MEIASTWKQYKEIQTSTEKTYDKEKLYENGRENQKAESSNQRMDKLFFDMQYENIYGKDRCPFENKIASDNLEAVESAEQKAMGLTVTGNRKRFSKTDILYGKPLSMGRNENMCSESNQ